MLGRNEGCLILGGLTCLLALAGCAEGTSDRLENVGGSSGAAGSGGSSAVAGAAGNAGAPADAGVGGTGGSGPVAGQNLFPDPSFEAGVAGWTPMGTCTLERVTDVAHTGSASLLVTQRTDTWHGPGFEVEDIVAAGTRYAFRAWVRQASVDPTDVGDAGQARDGGDGAPRPQRVGVTMQRMCSTDVDPGLFTPLTQGSDVDSSWTELSGTFEAPTCELTALRIYIEGPPPGVNFNLDDVSLVAVP